MKLWQRIFSLVFVCHFAISDLRKMIWATKLQVSSSTSGKFIWKKKHRWTSWVSFSWQCGEDPINIVYFHNTGQLRVPSHAWWSSPTNHSESSTYHHLSVLTTYWLVVYLPLWKIWVRQLGWWNSKYGKHVPKHQPDINPHVFDGCSYASIRAPRGWTSGHLSSHRSFASRKAGPNGMPWCQSCSYPHGRWTFWNMFSSVFHLWHQKHSWHIPSTNHSPVDLIISTLFSISLQSIRKLMDKTSKPAYSPW